jgi:hypothetical protein
VRRVGLALVHFPVLDRQGATVTSAITNLDVHDIARSAMTYGLSVYFVIHPIPAQRQLVERIRQHWVDGSGGRRIPDRVAPMRLVSIMPNLEEAIHEFAEGQTPWIWTTSAASVRLGQCLSYQRAATLLRAPGPPVLLVFGTGWGLAQSIHEAATAQLLPINAPHASNYNHLSVRAAVAIVLDRLLGDSAVSIAEPI